MSVSAVYVHKTRTDVYNHDGRMVYTYGKCHESVSGGGNTILIDASESQGCMIQITFDDEGNVINEMTLSGRQLY